MSARTPKPIKTAQRVLFGLCPLADILGLEPEAMEPWAEWLFSPAAVLADLADPASYPRRSPALARRALAEAAGEALQVLAELAEGGLVHSPRLRARLCMAAREELAAIVAEWQAVRVNQNDRKVTA